MRIRISFFPHSRSKSLEMAIPMLAVAKVSPQGLEKDARLEQETGRAKRGQQGRSECGKR